MAIRSSKEKLWENMLKDEMTGDISPDLISLLISISSSALETS